MTDQEHPTDVEVREWLEEPGGMLDPRADEKLTRLARALLAARERILKLEQIGDRLATRLRDEKPRVYQRVQATGVPHSLPVCRCISCSLGDLLQEYQKVRHAE